MARSKPADQLCSVVISRVTVLGPLLLKGGGCMCAAGVDVSTIEIKAPRILPAV
jgi:hypothetical protein